MVIPLYREAVIVQYRMPFEDDDVSAIIRTRAEFDRDFSQRLIGDAYFSAIFKRKYIDGPGLEPDSPANNLAIWMMHRAIANRTILSIAQKVRFGKHVNLMNSEEQLRVQEEINLEMGYVVQFLQPDMPGFAELNPALFVAMQLDLTESNLIRPTLVED
jgi:hypothetical protein